MTKHIATHKGMMHADEITAVALLRLFTNDEIVVHRIEHESTDFSAYDMVIDIGKTFDGVKYFDHHQHKGGKSSAGLIWDYLGLGTHYPNISKLIDIVDRNDVGIEKAKPFEYSSLLKCYNTTTPNASVQDEAFEKAVEVSMTVLDSMRAYEQSKIESKEIVANSFLFDGNPMVLELEHFTSHWGALITPLTFPSIKAVVWEDEEDRTWKIRIIPQKTGSFKLVYRAFKQDAKMKFVHSAGHFAIADTEEQMEAFVKRHFKPKK